MPLPTMINKELSRKRLSQIFIILIVFVLMAFYFWYQPLGLKVGSIMESVTGGLQTSRLVETQNINALGLSEPKVNESEDIFQPTPISKLQVMNVVDLYKRYLKLVEVPTFKCTSQKRYGNVDDGGWEVCEQYPFTLTAPCLVHSWGINWDFSFDDAISGKLGCHVHAFDPSMNVTSFNRSDKIIFHDFGIKGLGPSKHTTWNMKTFNQTLRDLQQEKSQIDYMKMDVDGDEWDVLTTMLDKDNNFKHMRQVAFEFHLKPCVTQQQIVKAVNILYRMRQIGLELYHSHRNPFGLGKNTNFLLGQDKAITCCHEVYYVNTKYQQPT